MTTLNYNLGIDPNLEKERIFNRVCTYLEIEKPIMYSNTIEDGVKELCVARMCKSIGIKCYNYKNKLFNFYATVTGEAVSQELGLKLQIASAEIKFIKYDKINLINQIRFFLISSDIDEAFVEAYNFLDKYKYLAK